MSAGLPLKQDHQSSTPGDPCQERFSKMDFILREPRGHDRQRRGEDKAAMPDPHAQEHSPRRPRSIQPHTINPANCATGLVRIAAPRRNAEQQGQPGRPASAARPR